jgi:hypothetical protein
MDHSLENRIRERAYKLWNAHGCVHGQADQHWLAAEREILAASTAAITHEPAPQKREILAASTTAHAREPAPQKKRRPPARSKVAKTVAVAS